LFIALVSKFLDQRESQEVGVLRRMHFGLVDWEKHLLDPSLGVKERAFGLHYLNLKGIEFTIDGTSHTTKVLGLFMAFQPVPDFGVKRVLECLTKGYVILFGFRIHRVSQ